MDVWSNHACQVALFFPSISTACSSRSVRSSPASELLAQVGPFVLPRPQEMHPSARGAREPTGSVISNATRSSQWSCCHWIGQGMHPNSLDKVRVRAVGPSFSQRATARVPGDRGGLKKSKDKGKRPIQRRIAKRKMKDLQPIQRRIAKDLQITKLGDDQERRAKWRKTKGRELLASTKKNVVDGDSQESPTAKTCSSYEKEPARIKKYQKNRDSF